MREGLRRRWKAMEGGGSFSHQRSIEIIGVTPMPPHTKISERSVAHRACRQEARRGEGGDVVNEAT